MALYLVVYDDRTAPHSDEIRTYLGYIPELVGKSPPEGGIICRCEQRRLGGIPAMYSGLMEVRAKERDPEGVFHIPEVWIIHHGLRNGPYALEHFIRAVDGVIADIGGIRGSTYQSEFGFSASIVGGNSALLCRHLDEAYANHPDMVTEREQL